MGGIYGSANTISVTISYTRNSNERYLESLIDIIKSFETRRKYNVSVYIDRGNIGGDLFDVEIPENFKNADIIICLVNNNFLKHPYIVKKEKPIIKKFSRWWIKDKRVVPIIVTKTINYPNSWLGKRKLTTLPDETAPKRPYSYYDNEEYARTLVKEGLNEIFIKFHNDVVLPRLKNKKQNSLLLTIITVLLIIFFLLKYVQSNSNHGQIDNRQEPPEFLDPSRPIVRIDPDNPQVSPPVVRPTKPKSYEVPESNKRTRDPDLPNITDDEELISRQAVNCNSKVSMESVFPRDISFYPYYGKERYFRYESCQGLNKEGYKPCKLNRRWYIVNEKKNQHLLLKLTPEVHKKIFAIRPLLNNVAEVYYYDGHRMYLEFCVSLSDGEEIE